MKLRELVVSGFRGFPSSVTLDVDADAVVIIGANGCGKTSFFDAILWGLTGSIPRVSTEPGSLVNRYGATGEARVELTLEQSGEILTITRRWDGAMNLSATIGDEHEPLHGASAEALILDRLWPDAQLSSNPLETLERTLTRAVYLQQDLIRQFIEADGDQDRFSVITELVGSGRVTELIRQLDSAKRAWSASTNVLATEVEPLRTRRATASQRLERLTDSAHGDGGDVSEEWSRWREQAARFIPLENFEVEQSPTRSVDVALRALQAAELERERRLNQGRQLARHIDAEPPAAGELEPLQAGLRAAEAGAEQSQHALLVGQEQAAEQRRRSIEQRESEEEMRFLAELALRHLDEHCPVCEQTYDVDATRKRLRRLAKGDGVAAETPPLDVSSLAESAQAAERARREALARLRAAQDASDAKADWQRLRSQLAEGLNLDLESPDLKTQVQDRQQYVLDELGQIQALRRAGERIGLQLARASEFARRADLERDIENLDREIRASDAQIAERNATGDLAGRVLNGLRSASETIVTDELERLEPTLQRVYSAIDPHPSFRAVHFLTRTVRGRGRLWTTVDDPTAEISIEEPKTVLSSSQLNVLALSVFLSLNLGVGALPLSVVALDDPLQSLDDVNLLGFVDLLRRIKGPRQVIVSAHDERLGELLLRKLRPVTSDQRTRAIRLASWGREGPDVQQDDFPPDPKPLRLVA
jgi:DNA repair exonuclease SbcCD ATPase subunit